MAETGLKSPLDRFPPFQDEVLALEPGNELFTSFELHALTQGKWQDHTTV